MNVSDRVRDLRARDPVALRSLPSKDEADVMIDGKKHTIITWHDEPSPGDHRIVVAAYTRSLAGIATRVVAEGFVVSADGRRRDLTSDELAPFQ